MNNHRGKATCSGCSVFMFGILKPVVRICSVSRSGAVVDKMWKSGWKSMWGICEKVSTLLQERSGYDLNMLKSARNCGKCGKIYTEFCTVKSSLLNSLISTVSTGPITIITNYLIERRF